MLCVWGQECDYVYDGEGGVGVLLWAEGEGWGVGLRGEGGGEREGGFDGVFRGRLL